MRTHINFDLTHYNSYRLKASCKRAFFPETELDILDFFKRKEPFVLLGCGNNIILSQENYDIDFLILNDIYDNIIIDLDSKIIEAESGATMLHISKLAMDNGLSGIEMFYDIPSSLGGAIVMNAGASGEEIKDVLLKVRYLDIRDMQIREILKEEISFGYRNSFFQRNTDKIVLKAWLKLQSGDRNLIQQKMEDIKSKRWEKQPKEFPNAGSVFKRPSGYYVGAIIEDLGLKGLTIGGAKISEKHGGFIVNYNNAKGEDIVKLIEIVRSKVWDEYGINLEIEQRII